MSNTPVFGYNVILLLSGNALKKGTPSLAVAFPVGVDQGRSFLVWLTYPRGRVPMGFGWVGGIRGKESFFIICLIN